MDFKEKDAQHSGGQVGREYFRVTWLWRGGQYQPFPKLVRGVMGQKASKSKQRRGGGENVDSSEADREGV